MPGKPVAVHDAGGSLKAFQRRLAPLRRREAIVFIHGFGGDWAETWEDFPNYLVDERSLSDWDLYSLGYDSHLRVDLLKLGSADPDLQKLADKLVTDVRAGELWGYGSLALVADSMGGLVVQRALLDSGELLDRVSHVFLFGTRSGGLGKASRVRLLKPQLRDRAKEGALSAGCAASGTSALRPTNRQRSAAQEAARQVIEHCRLAATNELASDRKWRLATEGEALLHLGDVDTALACYREAIAPEHGAQPREIESMYQQAIYLSRDLGDTSLRRAFTYLFRNEDAR